MIGKALFFEAPRRVAVREVEVAPPSPGEVLVRGLASAVSQGTELLLYRGEGPEPFDPSLPSLATYPRRYGYAWVGVVIAGALPAGRRVFALAPHGDLHVLAPGDVRPIRDDIPPGRAALAANLETAVTCAWDAEAAVGDRAVVLGGGVVGVLSAWLLVSAGAQVTLIEPRAARRLAAKELVPDVFASSAPDGRADVVVEASGDPRALDDAIAWAAPGARIVVASFYGARRAPVALGDAFHRRRLSLVASQVSTIPPRLAARWTIERRFALVERILGDARLDALIAAPVPFAQAPDLYARLDAAEDPLPCHVFDYS